MNTDTAIFSVDRTIEDKRQLFIDATIHSLAEHGYKGTTVRQIAKVAKVAPGLLTHYYSGKEELIAESYKYLAQKFLNHFQDKITRKKNNPLEALRTFFIATFEEGNLNPKLLRVWISFWSLTLIHKDLRHIHKETYRQYITSIENMLIQAYTLNQAPVDLQRVKSQAIGINALLDGLWIEWCLDPDSFSPRESLQIVYDFVEGATGLVISPNDPE